MLDKAIVQEVREIVLERGHVNKSDIVETYRLTEDNYAELQEQILADRSIRKGPRRSGGFVLQEERQTVSEKLSDESPLLTTQWERDTVGRLTQLLTRDTLKTLLGDLHRAVRRLRDKETGIDSTPKVDLATALVIQHGIDLFCEPAIRQRVGAACKVNPPKRWHPGKGAPVEFVCRTGFPSELIGVPTPDSLPDYEDLDGRFDLRRLENFQEEVKERLDDVLKSRGGRAIMTLPTGAGKTRVAVESIRDLLAGRYDVAGRVANQAGVLWLAHTEELCEQAYACFRQVWTNSENVCPLRLIRFWGHYTRDMVKYGAVLQEILSRPTVLISTPHRIVNLLDDRVEGGESVIEGLRKSLGVLLIDEAHRAAAPSYRRILKDLPPSEHSVSVAGLTATPFRMEYDEDNPEKGTRELVEIFHDIIEPIRTLGDDPRERLEKLQEREILARPVWKTIHTHTIVHLPDVSKEGLVGEEEMEWIDRGMALAADKTQRRLVILEHLLPFAREEANSILYFGPSVRDAECMAFLLRREHIPAAVVTGNTRDVTRRQLIREFKDKTIRVLCNCEVLTTGFDAPRVTHIVVARPTVSGVLYEQMVGRGLRGPRFGGTESCVILNCQDDFRGRLPPLGCESWRSVWMTSPRREAVMVGSGDRR
ncbi:MAG: DEAD/DEAH box helicase [Sedimentisphaerales bacterium]|nr:DEAD/DEAH box helicase [Sedimentisphaerales bacterium]